MANNKYSESVEDKAFKALDEALQIDFSEEGIPPSRSAQTSQAASEAKAPDTPAKRTRQVPQDDAARRAAEGFVRVTEVTGAGICIAAVSSPTPRDDVIRSLRLCADIVRETGARLALEFTSYGGLTSLSEAIDLCAAVGWERCGVLVDSLHFFRTGEPWSDLRALDGDQIALVHLDDAPAATGHDSMFESRFGRLPPGAGSLPLEDFRDAIATTGYRGVVSAEVLSAELRALSPEEGARALIGALRQVWPL